MHILFEDNYTCGFVQSLPIFFCFLFLELRKLFDLLGSRRQHLYLLSLSRSAEFYINTCLASLRE